MLNSHAYHTDKKEMKVPCSSLFVFQMLAIFLAAGCAHSTHDIRYPSSGKAADPTQTQEPVETPVDAADLAIYQEGVAEFTAEREAMRSQVSHEKHLPALYLQNQPSEYVVVLLHGLFESPFYLKGLAKNFHARGYNVVVPLLPKHWAIPLSEINKSDFHQWLEYCLANVRRAHKLGKKVLLAGHSTGGLLAVYTAIQLPELVDGLMLWSPALALSNRTYYSSLAGTLSNDWVDLDYNKLAGKPPQDPENVAYYSPLAGLQVQNLEKYMLTDYEGTHSFVSRPFWSVKRSMYSSVKVPVFLVTPSIDKVVDRPEMDFFYETLSVPKFHLDLPGEEHESTPHGPLDFYEGAQKPNGDFPGMLEKLNSFLDQNFGR